MLLMSCSDTSVPMEISAASFTSASTSSGRMSDRSEVATFVRSPAGPIQIKVNLEFGLKGDAIVIGPNFQIPILRTLLQ